MTESATAPIRMRRVPEPIKIRRVGDFYWHISARGDRYLRVAVPGLRRHVVRGLRCGRGGLAWDGDEERPTLKQLIVVPYWRGYVRSGFLVPEGG